MSTDATSGRDLLSLPKGHLHLHLEGGMRKATLIELAAHYGIALPAVSSYRSFTEFSKLYEAACAVLRTHEDLRRLVREAVEDAAASGAVWLELGVRPTLHLDRFATEEEIIETFLAEAAATGEELGVGVGLLMTIDRTQPLKVAKREAELAASYAGSGVVAIGLANDEVGHPPEVFAGPFEIARAAGLLSCPHAGELEGPLSVWGALEALGADRVQHGVRAVDDASLMDKLAASGVCLDVCPTSNVCLGIVDSLESHPLPRLLEAGIRCSLNGDDPLFFGAELVEEYRLVREKLDVPDEQLAEIARASIECSGAPDDLKATARSGIDAWIAGPPVPVMAP